MTPALESISSFDIGGAIPAAVNSSPPLQLIKRLAENFGTMSPWGWPMYWQAYQDSTYPGPGGFPYRGASGTTNDRAHGRDIPFFWSEVDLRGYRVTSRFLAETNPFAIGFMNLLTGYHIRKGYGWQACLKGTRKTPYAGTSTNADPLVEKAQRILDQFRRVNKWSVLSREAFYRWRVDGEVFLRLGQNHEDGLWCRIIEPEQIGAADGSTTDPWSYGIGSRVYDDGRVDPLTAVEYHVWDLDSGMTHGEYVDAAYMVHAKANVMANVKRGRPDFFPVLDLFDSTRQLYSNMLHSAVRQAAYAWLEKFPNSNLNQVAAITPEFAPGNGQGYPVDQSCGTWGRGQGWWGGPRRNQEPAGTILRVEGTRELIPMPADGRGANFELIVKLAMRAARMRWNLPGSASGDAEDTTFAAAIQAGGPFPVAVEGSQTEWGECFEEPVALKVLDRAVEAGLLSREERAKLDVEVTEPAVVTPEPDKDTQRRQTLNAAKVLSVTTWQQQEGLDPQHEAQNFKAESEQGQQQQPGAGGPVSTPPDDQGGLFGESAEWVSESAYHLLSEEGRQGLVQKKITVKGKGGKEYQRTVWVKPAQPKVDMRAAKVKKTITNTAGKKQTVWVRPGDDTHDQDSGKQPDEQPGQAAKGNGDVGAAGLKPDEKIDLSEITNSDAVKKDPSVLEKVKTAAKTAFKKAVALISDPKAALYTIAYHTPQILGLWGDLFDEPKDLQKIGYNPSFSGTANQGTLDVVKNATQIDPDTLGGLGFGGIPSHMAAGLAIKIGAAAIVAAKRKLGMIESDGGMDYDAAGEFIHGLLSVIAEEMGLTAPPDAASIAEKLRGLST